MNRAHITQHQLRRAVAAQTMAVLAKNLVVEPPDPVKPKEKIKSKDKRIEKKAIYD